MCNDNCIYCEERQLTYDLDGVTKLNTLQAEVIVELTAQVARLKAGIAQLKMEHAHDCGYNKHLCWVSWSGNWGDPGVWNEVPGVCTCNADAHNAAVDALFGDNTPTLGSAHNIRQSFPFAEETARCLDCGNELQEVRPGKLQCLVCE